MKTPIFLLSVLLVASSCSAKPDPGLEGARDSLVKLQRIQAATQVGVNQITYGTLLIDAKASLNKTNSLLADGPLKKELNAAQNAYEDASAAWRIEEIIYSDTPAGRELKSKYPAVPEETRYGRPYIFPNSTLSPIWATAALHIEKAESLLAK